jgi:hypothetical protein
MASGLVLVIVLVLAVSLESAKLKVFPDADTKDCTVGGKTKYVDFTGITHEAHNDTYFTLEGELIKTLMIKVGSTNHCKSRKNTLSEANQVPVESQDYRRAFR